MPYKRRINRTRLRVHAVQILSLGFQDKLQGQIWKFSFGFCGKILHRFLAFRPRDL